MSGAGISFESSPPRAYTLDPMQWTKPLYSKTRRTNAGLALARDQATDEDLIVIDNWRSSHAPPLQSIKMLLKRRAKSADAGAIVAQRLKRLPSIRAKLQRETMRLPQMQDLGGCRAIVKDMAAVRKLVAKFDESAKKDPKREDLKRHKLFDSKDYITDPKADGYRSIHYIMEFQSASEHLQCFVGHLIEVQIRTKLQHAWATAVEIVDTFTGQSLKSSLKTNIGDADWRRFFALISNVFAVEETSPAIPGMPESELELKRELRSLAAKTDVERVLAGLNAAVSLVGSQPALQQKSAASYVLKLNVKHREVTVSAFRRQEDAQLQFFEDERTYAADPSIQLVQVSVEKMQALRTAYPNYYLDTTMFLDALRKAIAPVPRNKSKTVA